MKRSLISAVKEIYIKSNVLSDYDFVLFYVSFPSKDQNRRGPRYWKRNASILDNPETIHTIENLWYQELADVHIPDTKWWENCKAKFKQTLIMLSKKYKRECDEE